MKVLMLTDGITPYVMGGMQKHSFLFSEQIAARGHDVTLFHCAPDMIEEDEVLSQYTPGARPNLKVYSFVYSEIDSLPGHYLRSQKSISKRYFEKLNSLQPFDFIFTKGFMGWYLLENRHLLRYNTCIGVKFHGMNMFQRQADLKGEIQKYMLRYPVRRIMYKADLVFSYGGCITSIIERELKKGDKIVELPTAIDQSWVINDDEIWESNDDRVNFLFIGRYDRVKGLPELYKALEQLKSKSENWTFHFVGPIPDNKRLEYPRCIYHGAIQDENQLKGIIDQCDVLVNTSISEGMPNVILEAMARGLAVLATNVGATSMLIDKNGILIERNSPNLILNGLLRFLKLTKQELYKMQLDSLHHVRQFNWDNIISDFERIVSSEIALKN